MSRDILSSTKFPLDINMPPEHAALVIEPMCLHQPEGERGKLIQLIKDLYEPEDQEQVSKDSITAYLLDGEDKLPVASGTYIGSSNIAISSHNEHIINEKVLFVANELIEYNLFALYGNIKNILFITSEHRFIDHAMNKIIEGQIIQRDNSFLIREVLKITERLGCIVYCPHMHRKVVFASCAEPRATLLGGVQLNWSGHGYSVSRRK
jgi:hypothetical protein